MCACVCVCVCVCVLCVCFVCVCMHSSTRASPIHQRAPSIHQKKKKQPLGHHPGEQLAAAPAGAGWCWIARQTDHITKKKLKKNFKKQIYRGVGDRPWRAFDLKTLALYVIRHQLRRVCVCVCVCVTLALSIIRHRLRARTHTHTGRAGEGE